MVIPKVLQAYMGGSLIRGVYGNASEIRAASTGTS
jgi:hypothetical protein